MSRPKREFRTISKENYNHFRETYKKIDISYDTYKKIMLLWNRKFMKHILETGDKLKLPHGLGGLTISKHKKKKFKEVNGETIINYRTDWKATREAGKRIYHLNYHSEGYSFYWCWFPNDARMKYNFIWSFKAQREHSRAITEYLKKPGNYKDLYKQWVRYK